jgi:hypothetical protein
VLGYAVASVTGLTAGPTGPASEAT